MEQLNIQIIRFDVRNLVCDVRKLDQSKIRDMATLPDCWQMVDFKPSRVMYKVFHYPFFVCVITVWKHTKDLVVHLCLLIY